MKFKYIVIVLGMSLVPLQYEFANAVSQIAIVATVNGEMISTLDIEKAIESEIIIQKIDKNAASFQEKRTALRSELINVLIEEKVLLLEAKKQSMSISDNRLEQEIQNSIKSSNLSETAFYKKVADTGFSKEEYREKLRKTLTTQDLIRRNVLRKIIISNDDILGFYQSRGGNLNASVEVALLIYPSTGVAAKYGNDLKSGKSDFEETTKSISVGPNADLGGSLGVMSITDLAAPIQFQVQKLDEGEVSNIFSLGDQEAQIMLISKGELSDNPLDVMDDATRSRIVDTLRQQKVGTRIVEYIAQLKDKAIINIKN